MTQLTLIGQKTDQAQSFLQNGRRIPVTEIAISENVVMQIKNKDNHSYSAIQLGTGVKKKANKGLLGHAKKAGRDTAPLKIKEVVLKDVEGEDMPSAGDVLTVENVFKPGDLVQVTGTSKGKGFAGVVRRYNFRGGPKTHGQSDRHRAPGSIGQTTTPGRVYKGKRMAGRMGSDTVTIKNLTVVDVDSENQKLYVMGLVPGHKNTWIYITRTGENKKYVPLIQSEEKKAAEEARLAAQAQAEEVAKTEEAAEIKASPNESDEPKEVKSDTEKGETKSLDSEEKEEMSQKAKENVSEEKKADDNEKKNEVESVASEETNDSKEENAS